MSISEQVKELRDKADVFERSGCAVDGIVKAFLEAADTIESLSAKLQAANNNSFYEVLLHNIAEEIISMRRIWSELEKPPYNEFEQEVYLSGLRKARDIILQAANMERLAEDCRGWIYCGDGKNLPEEHDSMFAKFKGTEKWNLAMFEKISDDVNVTVEFENGERKTKTLHTVDGKWNGGQRGVKFKVIAWQKLPEPYHP